MPRIDGREVIKIIKADPKLQMIPILILTTSQTETDIQNTYAEGASGFITKPTSFQGLVNVMKSVGQYWLRIVELPDPKSPRESV